MSLLPQRVSIPYWLRGEAHDVHKTFRSTKKLPDSASVVIIGAGMTGASCAYHLTELGVKNVVVLDARGLCEGATGRNAGHLWSSPFYVSVPTKELIDKYGIDQLKKEVAFQYHNTRLMLKFVEDFQVPCEAQMTGSLRVATSPEELTDIKKYIEALTEMGLNLEDNIEFWDAEKCRKASNCPNVLGGVHYKLAGQAWPAQIVWRLCDVAHARGVNLQAQTPVLEVTKSGGKYLVKTERGQILADKVLYATNAYTAGLVPQLKDVIVPTRGQLIVTSPLVGMSFPMPIWLNFGYEYVNQRLDKRLIVGGMRWKSPTKETGESNDAVVSPVVGKGLREFAEEYFPGIKNEHWKVDYEWTGVMAFTPDENPLVGKLRDNEYIAAGFTGYGMPRTFLSGKVVAEMIAGNPRPEFYLPQFDPARYYKPSKL